MNKLAVILIGFVLISGCAEIDSEMPTKTNTPSIIANTLAPIASPTITFTSTVTLTMPLYAPTPMIKDPYGHYIDWGDIPIMPGANSGDLEGRKYTFDIKSEPEEVKAYYEKTLKNHNWKFVRLDPKPNATIDPNNPFVFQFIGWDHQLLSFSIIYKNESSHIEIDFETYGSYY